MVGAGRRYPSGAAGWVVLAALAVGALCTAQAVAAPTVTDQANQVLRQNERNAERAGAGNQPPAGGVVVAPAQRAELPPAGGPMFRLKSVTFEPPSAFLSQAELDAITAKYIGQMVDFRQISALVRDVNDLYAKKGVVTAGAVLPPQNLKSGELKVQLVEGREGKVAIVGTHLTKDDVFLKAVRLTRDGDIVDVPTASQDIARFNKTHHAQLSLLLQPGATFGLTDLTLGVREPPPNIVQLSVDDYGANSTGAIEASALYQRYGLLGIDDQMMFLATAAQGSLAGTANFDMPIGNLGTRLALGATASTIKVIAGPTLPLDITGNSKAVTATLTQALYTGVNLSVIGLATLSYGTSQSFAAGTPLVDTSTTKGAIGAALSYANDKISIDAQPEVIFARSDDNLFSTQRDITLFAGNGDVTIPLGNSFSIQSRGAWQYTTEQLLPGDLLFQIGGHDTVRGYSSDGVAGDTGFFVQNELHWSGSGKTQGLDLYGLLDVGQVHSTFPATTTLASLGAGWTYQWPNNSSLDVSAAVPLLPAIAGQPSLGVYAKLTGSFQ